jgi:MoaA/NifB/PqqE/SkfB family radical SAM enzyme
VFEALRRIFGQAGRNHSLPAVLQIEVTSRCQLSCTFCPNHVLGDKWIRGDFPWELYRDELAPYFSAVEWIYLQGWGEPLLHPRLWDMFSLAKAKAQHVGFTSNGVLLTEANARRLIAEAGDLIDISFSGNTAATHETLRSGSNLARLKQNVRRLADLKAQANSHQPIIVLSYLLTRPSIGELPDFIDTAAELGANEVVAINLDYTPYRKQDELRVFSNSEPPLPEYEALLQEAAARAERYRLIFRRYPLAVGDRMLVCDARPLDTVFINHRGQITPCTYLGLSVEGEIPRLFCGQSWPVQPVSYGHVADGLPEVWHGAAACAFKHPFAHRQAFAGPVATLLSVTESEIPAPPPQCEFCHKLYKI